MSRSAGLLLALLLCGCHDEHAFPPGSSDTFSIGDGSEAERRGMERIRARARRGDVDAAFDLVSLELRESKAYAEAFPRLRGLADSGSVGAASLLAVAYQYGRGTEVDYAEAARWLRRAADLGDAGAARDLAAYEASVRETEKSKPEE